MPDRGSAIYEDLDGIPVMEIHPVGEWEGATSPAESGRLAGHKRYAHMTSVRADRGLRELSGDVVWGAEKTVCQAEA